MVTSSTPVMPRKRKLTSMHELPVQLDARGIRGCEGGDDGGGGSVIACRERRVGSGSYGAPNFSNGATSDRWRWSTATLAAALLRVDMLMDSYQQTTDTRELSGTGLSVDPPRRCKFDLASAAPCRWRSMRSAGHFPCASSCCMPRRGHLSCSVAAVAEKSETPTERTGVALTKLSRSVPPLTVTVKRAWRVR